MKFYWIFMGRGNS